MRKKLMSIQNMKAMAMEQSLRKQNGDNRKIQMIQINEYREKLEKLLQKLTVQTKYTNRVTQCNLRNIEELQQVKKELNRLLDLRKMQEKNEVMLKNLSNQLAQTLTQTQQKLIIATNEVFQLKKQIKMHKKQINELKKNIEKLNLQLKASQREKFQSIIQLYDKEDNKLISTLIEDYVKQIKHPSSIILYKHCVQTLKNKTFNTFLKTLELKMNSLEIQNKDTLRLKQAEQVEAALSRRKLSNLTLINSAITVQSKTNTNKKHSFKLPSFRLKTQKSQSLQKYPIF